MKTLDQYLSIEWRPVIEMVTEDGHTYHRLTIPLLPDFAVYGETLAEVGARYPEALESHLAGYLAVGKVIPEPPQFGRMATEPDAGTGSNAQPGTNIIRDKQLIAA